MLAVLLALTLSQDPDYVRNRVDGGLDCLAWRELAVTLHQSERGTARVAGDDEFTAISRSIATWNLSLEACSDRLLIEGERTSSRDIGFDATGANENIVVFRSSRCDDVVPQGHPCRIEGGCANVFDCWAGSALAIAVTLSTSRKDGGLVDADIEFNDAFDPSGVGFVFTTVDAPKCPVGTGRRDCVATDVENTATHELGHFLGLGHSKLPGSTMFEGAEPGETKKRTLDPASQRFLCEVYPRGRPSSTCVVPRPPSTLGARGCGAVNQSPWLFALVLLIGLRRGLAPTSRGK